MTTRQPSAGKVERCKQIMASLRNRGRKSHFLSDEIAFEKAMAAIGKANQSLKAMAIHARQGHGAKLATARKAVLRHYDESGTWARKIAERSLRRKITSAQESFWRSYDAFHPMHGGSVESSRTSRRGDRAARRSAGVRNKAFWGD